MTENSRKPLQKETCPAARTASGGAELCAGGNIRKVRRISRFFVLQFSLGCGIVTYRCGCSSSVERQLPKLHRWVRLPSAAPVRRKRHIACDEFFIKTHRSLILLLLTFQTANAALVCGLMKRGLRSRCVFFVNTRQKGTPALKVVFLFGV